MTNHITVFMGIIASIFMLCLYHAYDIYNHVLKIEPVLASMVLAPVALFVVMLYFIKPVKKVK